MDHNRVGANRLATAAAFVGVALLGMRAGAGVLQAIYVTATAGDVEINSLLWEFWLLTGAVLFGFLAWRDRRGAFLCSYTRSSKRDKRKRVLTDAGVADLPSAAVLERLKGMP